MVEKLQAANKSKLGNVIGRMDNQTMQKLGRSLLITLGLADG